jgi:hypothetical protein
MRTINCSLTVGSPRDRGCRAGRLTGSLTSKWFILFALALLAVAFLPTSAFAQTCLLDEYNNVTKGKLNCTANDVSIAAAVNPRNPDGTPISTCFAGTKFSFIADFQVVTTATARENIGFYMAVNGQSNALTGSCVDNIVSPLHDPGSNTRSTCVTAGTIGTQCLGSALYHEFDTSLAGDNCGDTTSADGTSQFVTILVSDITCPALGTQFVLPNCTSWQQPGGAIQCASTPPNTAWPWVQAAIPGSPSKCNCSSVNIPITPIDYTITVSKTPSPASLPEPGGNFTYTVGVKNTTSIAGSFGNEIIDQVCDNKFGNIGTVGACSGGTNAGTSCTTSATCGGGTCVLPSSCPAGSLCSSPNNVAGTTCATSISCTLPQTVASGITDSSLCTFQGSYTPGTEGSLKDTVTVNGFGNTGQLSPPAVSGSADATVTISEGPAKVSVSKSLDSGRACATVRYKVEVDNTSDASTDESETLSVLNDNPGFGDVTRWTGSSNPNPLVLGTTCGQDKSGNGVGTLSTVAGAGTLPATILPGGNYTCYFDGQFCAALGTVTGTSCTTGLVHHNTINATVVGDDTNPADTLTGSTASSLTTDVCFTSSTP